MPAGAPASSVFSAHPAPMLHGQKLTPSASLAPRPLPTLAVLFFFFLCLHRTATLVHKVRGEVGARRARGAGAPAAAGDAVRALALSRKTATARHGRRTGAGVGRRWRRPPPAYTPRSNGRHAAAWLEPVAFSGSGVHGGGNTGHRRWGCRRMRRDGGEEATGVPAGPTVPSASVGPIPRCWREGQGARPVRRLAQGKARAPQRRGRK